MDSESAMGQERKQRIEKSRIGDSPKWQLARWIFCGIFSFVTFRFPNWGLEFYDVASTVHVGYGDTPAIRRRINPHIQSTSSILGGTVRETEEYSI